MAAAHFYITLRSDLSSDADGTPARFTTALPERMELDGEWEVGLSEISFPSLRHNISHDRHYLRIGARTTLPLRNVHCDDVVDVLHETARAFNQFRRSRRAGDVDVHVVRSREEAVELVRDGSVGFYYVRNIGKVGFFLRANMRLQFSTDLAHILGFAPMAAYATRDRGLILGESKADMRSNRPHKTAYVYVDVVEPVIVGDAKVRLLRTVEADGDDCGGGGGSVVHRIFPSPVYLPLQTKNFGTTEIDIMTDAGEPMPFVGGKSIVVLHLRRVDEKYLTV